MKYLLDGEEAERLHFRLPDANGFDVLPRPFTDDKMPQTLSEEQCKAWFEKSKHRQDNDLVA
jgi:hypothetical protein